MPRDILLQDDDLLIADGDLVIGDSSLQHQRLLLLCDKGEFKEFPTRCVGASRFLETSRSDAFAREIDEDFNKDGMKVKRIEVNIPHIHIEADYE
jgi:hypothetical protein